MLHRDLSMMVGGCYSNLYHMFPVGVGGMVSAHDIQQPSIYPTPPLSTIRINPETATIIQPPEINLETVPTNVSKVSNAFCGFLQIIKSKPNLRNAK